MLPRIRILSTLVPRRITSSYPIPQRPLSLHSTFFYRMSSSSSQQPPAESTTTNNNNDQTKEQNEDSSSKPVLALPAPGDFSSMTSGAPSLEVNGQDIKLDLLGPVVVNEDGTMSRIDNWHEMTEIEKANVRRILLKRNNARLERLRAERDQAKADEEAAAAASKDN